MLIQNRRSNRWPNEHRVFNFWSNRFRKNRNILTNNRKVLKQGKSSIMLVPEISLTPQMVDRFIERFGQEK